MNIRLIVFLSLIVYSSASLIGMSRLGSRVCVVARNVASRNVARLKTDSAFPEVLSKEVSTGDSGCITISREDTSPKRLFVDYYRCNDPLNFMITIAFYMRSKDQQSVSLIRHHDISKLLFHVKEGMREARDACTRNGNVLEQITTIYTMADKLDTKSKLIDQDDLNTYYEVLLKKITSNTYTLSRKHNLLERVIVDCYSDVYADGFEFLLDPNPQKSVYNHMQRSESRGGVQYGPRLLYEQQHYAIDSIDFSGPKLSSK